MRSRREDGDGDSGQPAARGAVEDAEDASVGAGPPSHQIVLALGPVQGDHEQVDARTDPYSRIPAHRRRRSSLTSTCGTRYCDAMRVKNRWWLGLQWGASAWLGYVVWHACLDAYHTPIDETLSLLPEHWFVAMSWVLAPAWIVAAGLVLAGSGWSRAFVAATILMRVIAGTARATSYGGVPDPAFTARFFLPMCLPLLPLVVMRADNPRVVLALAALGRWREAAARSGGAHAIFAAATLLSVNHIVWNQLIAWHR